MSDRELLEANYALLVGITGLLRVVFWVCVFGLAVVLASFGLNIARERRFSALRDQVAELLALAKGHRQLARSEKHLAEVTNKEVRQVAVGVQETAKEAVAAAKEAVETVKAATAAVRGDSAGDSASLPVVRPEQERRMSPPAPPQG